MDIVSFIGQRMAQRDEERMAPLREMEKIALPLLTKGDKITPAELEVLRYIGNQAGNAMLQQYYQNAAPDVYSNYARQQQERAVADQMTQMGLQQMQGLGGVTGQGAPSPQPQSMPLGPPTKGEGISAGASAKGPLIGKGEPAGTPVTSELYAPQHPLTPIAAGAIRQGESGGDYNIRNKQGAVHTGAYQWHPDTWRSLSSQFAKDVLGQNVQQLPFTPENQDAVALYAMDKELMRSGKIENIPNLWYTGNPETTLTRGVGSAGSGAEGIPYDVPGYRAKFMERVAAMQKAQGGQPASQQSPAFAPATGQQQPTAQKILQNFAATKATFTVSDGKVNFHFQPFAQPSEADMKAAYLEELRVNDPPRYRSLIAGSVLTGTGMMVNSKMEYNKDLGRYIMTGMDPQSGQLIQIPLDRLQGSETAAESRFADAVNAGQKEFYQAQGKAAGEAEALPLSLDTANRREQGMVKLPDQKVAEAIAATSGTVKEMKDHFDVVMHNLVGPDGKVYLDRLPSGKWDALLQRFPDQLGLTDTHAAIFREKLVSFTTTIMQLMYALSGRQVTEGEIHTLQEFQQLIDLPPPLYAARMAQVQQTIKRQAEGKKMAFAQSGIDTKAIDEVLKEINSFDVTQMFPPEYRGLTSKGVQDLKQQQTPQGESAADRWKKQQGGR